MKRRSFYGALVSTTLLLGMIPTSLGRAAAQAVSTSSEQSRMTVEEFRQTLVDFGAYLDSRKGTTFSSQFEALPEESVKALLSGVQNPRRLQAAVASLRAGKRRLRDSRSSTLQLQAQSAQTASPFPNCPADTIIDTSSNATCTPAYPDPTNLSWRSVVDPLITFGAFSPSDYASVSSQQCGLTVESNLTITSNALQDGVQIALAGCSALNDVPAPATAVCFGPLALTVIPAAQIASTFYSECQEQDGNVNGAEIDAAFHNTVTIYDALGQATAGINTIQTDISSVTTDVLSLTTTVNADYSNLNSTVNTDFSNLNSTVNTDYSNLNSTVNTDFTTLNNNLNVAATKIGVEIANSTTTITTQLTAATTQITNQLTAFQNLDLRLKIEENLTNNSNPIGSFQLPQKQNGYLELALSIVADVINKLATTGQDVHNAQAKLAQANTDYSAGNYKTAYKEAGLAYSMAVN